MAKGGNKLTKLKSALKKWNSFSKTSPRSDSIAAAGGGSDGGDSCFSGELQAVYVGKSRRRYMVSPAVVEHPVFRELVDRSGEAETVNVACEVVLFEHLLWMLENGDPQPESLHEMVHFYSC